MAAGEPKSSGAQHPGAVSHGTAQRNLFCQFVRKLERMVKTDHQAVFIDGTKLESRAERYTFLWRKGVEKQLARVKEKLKTLTDLTTSTAVRWLLEGATAIPKPTRTPPSCA